MDKNRIGINIRCPSCSGQLYPRILVCDSCGIKIEGDFAQSEFASLTPDELHFLRVFIHCEGRIRDMEAALGVSYPTVKAHLTSIKDKLNLGAHPSIPADSGDGNPGTSVNRDGHESPPPAASILDELEQGRLSYKDALKLIKNRKKGADNASDHRS